MTQQILRSEWNFEEGNQVLSLSLSIVFDHKFDTGFSSAAVAVAGLKVGGASNAVDRC